MADILYGAKAAGATTSDLYTLNPASAAPSSIGATGHAFTSLAFDPTDGTLYGTTSAQSTANPDSLYTIDPLTGAATLVGAMGGTVSDIAFDSTGQLWGWTRRTSNGGLGGANATLLQIDKSDATFAVIGTSGLNMQGGGISFHSDGTLYGLLATGGVSHLYTINTSTGTITDLGGLTPSLGIANSATFDSADLLYMLLGGAGGTTSLKTINTGALTVATIGNPGNDFDALAWSVAAPPPPPAAATGGVRISVAFTDPALTTTPTYTSLHGLTGVRVDSWNVKRGRRDMREKTEPGTATITGTDTAGTLDPTNPDVYAAIVPNKPVKVELHNPVTDTWTTIYSGFVAAWRYHLHITGKWFTWTLECKDALGILADAEMIPDTAGNTVPAESTGDVYYEPQHGDDRIFALLADAALSAGVTEWPAGLTAINTLNVSVQGTVYSPRTSILQGLDDACDADFPWGANRYASKTGVITVHGRKPLFDPENPDYDVTFWKVGDHAACTADPTTAIISPLEFEVSEENLINAALATPNGILDADIAGQFVKDATSIAAYGARSISFENLITNTGDVLVGDPIEPLPETKLYATWAVDNLKDPRPRVSQLVFLHRDPSDPLAGPLWAALCGVEISDVASLVTTHPGGGGFAEDFFVDGISYEGRPGGHEDYQAVTMTLDLTARADYGVDPF